MVCPSDHVPEPNLSFSPQGRTDFFLAPSSDKRKKTRKQKIVEWWALLFVHAKISGNVPRFVGGLFLAGAQVLGTPTREEICAMNYNYSEFKFPQIKAHPWEGVFRSRTPPEVSGLHGGSGSQERRGNGKGGRLRDARHCVVVCFFFLV